MFKYFVLLICFLGWTSGQSICNNTCNPDDDHNLYLGCENTGGYFETGFAPEEYVLETFSSTEYFETFPTTQSLETSPTTEEIPQERPLLRTTVIVLAERQKEQVRRITYPDKGVRHEIITCIKVMDRISNNKGACPEVISGGVGLTEAVLEFVSQKGEDIASYVEIWGV